MFGIKKALNNLVFCNQNPDEKVLKIIRRGFVLELKWILPHMLIFLALFYAKFFVLNPGQYPIYIRDIIETFVNTAFLFVILSAFLKYINWFYSVNVVTNQRLMDFEFKELGFKSIVECQLKNIQSVSVKNEGFFSFIFGLSTLHILTSGDNPNIDFEFIYNANEVQDLISDMTRGVFPN